jgi:CHAT domain-containing protein/Flp pilus assembly protein TadD
MVSRSKLRFLAFVSLGLLYSQLLAAIWTMPLVLPVVAVPVQSHAKPDSSSSAPTQSPAADRLYEAGQTYDQQEEYALALQSLQQALQLYQNSGNRAGAMRCLYSIGVIYQRQGQYELALTVNQDVLAIARSLQDQDREWRVLTNLGSVHRKLGQYRQALSYHEQALAIVQALHLPTLEEQAVLNNMGVVHTSLGEFEPARKLYQQALQQLQQLPANQSEDDQRYQRQSQGLTLRNLGWLHRLLQQYPQAIAYYQQALELERQMQSRRGEAESLNKLGYTYRMAGQPQQARPVIEQALQLFQDLGDRDGTAYTLDSLGTVYADLHQWQASGSAYQQSLVILLEINDRPGQREVLSHVGDLLVQQNQSELAIVFYKRAINVTESIRRDLQGLPIQQRQSYTETIANTYRTLADLLLQQDRVLEAQQVLDLLKVQEIDDYLRRVRGNDQTGQGIPLLPQEQDALQQYETQLQQAVPVGRELSRLEQIPVSDRTPEQQQQVTALRQQQLQLQQAFNQFIDSSEVQTLLQKLRRTTDGQAIDPEYFNSWRQKLGELQQNAVVLYPFVLDDRLELILSTPNTPPLHRTVPVTRVQLNTAIATFRSALEDPNSDAKPSAQQLYNWLIRPLEEQLTQAQAQTILYAPDNQLRYIPLAALHDGRQWLVEKFRVNNITAISLFHLGTSPRRKPQVLAGAFVEGRHNFQLGSTRYGFSGLPFADTEVKTVARLFANTKLLVDRDFTKVALTSSLNDYNLTHLATHAMFVTGQPEDSFILLGNGELVTLRDISNWNLLNVDLIVLSACQTGVGALGNGEEILGFGYQVQKTGAKAAMATLWSVDDGGTEKLMAQFYAQLQQNNTTKAIALQQAQIAMIQGSSVRTETTPAFNSTQSQSTPASLALSHPYYWSSFILIGNGL